MSLTEKQRAAFEAASGTGVGGTWLVHGLFSKLLMAIVLLWAVWIALNAYKAWASKQISARQAAGAYIRAIMLILILITFFGT